VEGHRFQGPRPLGRKRAGLALSAWLAAALGCHGPAARDADHAERRAPTSARTASSPPPPPDAARPEERPEPPESPPVSSERARPPEITSVGYFTWIYGRPKVDKRFIGYVRFGQSVALRASELVSGPGCSKGFFQIEPRGFVCRDRTVTTEPSPRLVELGQAIAISEGPFPFRYALSNGAPMYTRIPTPKEQARNERPLGPAGRFTPLIKTLASHEDLARVQTIAPHGSPPSFFLDGSPVFPERLDLVRQMIPHGSMLSFTRAFEAEGRTWLLSADLTVVPADRVRPFAPSAFRGVRLDGKAALPLAWMRSFSRPKYRRTAAGAFEKTGAEWAARTAVGLSGEEVEDGGTRFLQTREQGDGGALYVASYDATVVPVRKKLPFGVKPDEKWILVSISRGTLVAYDGTTPFYSTLISPGAGGIPVKGQDLVKASTTPLGVFHVTFKDRAATMSPEKGENRSFFISDVPHTQYFAPPFALHATYWHERFGEPTSAGCINLSPIDAEILFGWTEPRLPPGWGGVTGAPAPENGPMTAIVITR
jgi:hypothetical protein